MWFAYKDEDWVLRDVSFTIEPGETIAVVGHTGAGKTTLISLLLRFYDVQRGAIRIGGMDVREFDPQELRRQFGVVLQDPYLFTGTLEENIRLGTEAIRREEVEAAAGQVNLLDFIRTLPEGFAHPIRERGSGLSTGQKQLIGFARALAHNPRFLILDEATSSVDTETEFRVREALAPHGGGPHVDRHRAPAFDDPARRPHPGDAQGPLAGIRNAPGAAGRRGAFTGSCTSFSTRTRRGWRRGPAFVQQFGPRMVDELHLPLRDLVDGVDVTRALDPVQIALMHRVHPHVSGTPIRLRLPPLPNRYRRRACRLVGHPALAVPAPFSTPPRSAFSEHAASACLPRLERGPVSGSTPCGSAWCASWLHSTVVSSASCCHFRSGPGCLTRSGA